MSVAGTYNKLELIIREQELKSIINSNAINMIFLVETDTVNISNENDYRIPGFKTIIQNKKGESLPTRIICLVNENLAGLVLIRMDLTSADFPSLWMEVENPFGKKGPEGSRQGLRPRPIKLRSSASCPTR